MGYIGVGVGGVNPLLAGTGGALWYYSPQSGVRNFPKKLTFLRLNDLVNFHNFIFSQKNDLFYDLVYFYDFYPISFQKKLTFSYTHPLLISKRQVEKIFPENFQILFTLLKNNFQFYFFCFINESPKKFFQKIFKNSQTPYRNEGVKIYRKN